MAGAVDQGVGGRALLERVPKRGNRQQVVGVDGVNKWDKAAFSTFSQSAANPCRPSTDLISVVRRTF